MHRAKVLIYTNARGSASKPECHFCTKDGLKSEGPFDCNKWMAEQNRCRASLSFSMYMIRTVQNGQSGNGLKIGMGGTEAGNRPGAKAASAGNNVSWDRWARIGSQEGQERFGESREPLHVSSFA